jgi:hypothetical protein
MNVYEQALTAYCASLQALLTVGMTMHVQVDHRMLLHVEQIIVVDGYLLVKGWDGIIGLQTLSYPLPVSALDVSVLLPAR